MELAQPVLAAMDCKEVVYLYAYASTLISIMVFPIVYNVITSVEIANQQSPTAPRVMLG
jgi:hypothetical protein